MFFVARTRSIDLRSRTCRRTTYLSSVRRSDVDNVLVESLIHVGVVMSWVAACGSLPGQVNHQVMLWPERPLCIFPQFQKGQRMAFQ